MEEEGDISFYCSQQNGLYLLLLSVGQVLRFKDVSTHDDLPVHGSIAEGTSHALTSLQPIN